jgi:hypothetical protein
MSTFVIIVLALVLAPIVLLMLLLLRLAAAPPWLLNITEECLALAQTQGAARNGGRR